jgi:hypothetical protein
VAQPLTPVESNSIESCYRAAPRTEAICPALREEKPGRRSGRTVDWEGSEGELCVEIRFRSSTRAGNICHRLLLSILTSTFLLIHHSLPFPVLVSQLRISAVSMTTFASDKTVCTSEGLICVTFTEKNAGDPSSAHTYLATHLNYQQRWARNDLTAFIILRTAPTSSACRCMTMSSAASNSSCTSEADRHLTCPCTGLTGVASLVGLPLTLRQSTCSGRDLGSSR